MAKGLLINLDRCTGCESCIVACKLENGLDLGDFYTRVFPVGPTGTFPDVEKYWLTRQCQQCANPACVAVCPVGASYVDDKTGYVLIDQDSCIGCQACISACPYNCRQMNADNFAQKCTLCYHVTADGKDVPACVHNCNCGARFFGDFDDPDSDVCREMAKYDDDCIQSLPSVNDSNPTTRYILSPKYAAWQGMPDSVLA